MKKRVTKKLISFMLVFVMAFAGIAGSGCFVKPAHAEISSDLDKAQEAINKGVKIMNTIKLGSWGGAYGKAAVEYAGKISKYIGTANKVLRFLGIGKKKPSQPSEYQLLQAELQKVHQELAQISEQIQNVLNTMEKYQLENKFVNKVNNIRTYNKEWLDFRDKFMPALDYHKNKYADLVNIGLEEWCINDDTKSRYQNGVDNRKLILVYDLETGELKFNPKNGEPESDDSYYITITEKALPETMDFNEEWGDNLGAVVTNTLREKLDAGDASEYVTTNLEGSILLADAWKSADDNAKNEMMDKLSQDIADTLAYRISVSEMKNKRANGDWVTKLKSDFPQYCKELVETKDKGLPALFKSICSSYNFEGEAKEIINEMFVCNMMQMGEFAMLAIDAVSKQALSPSSDLENISKAWTDASYALYDLLDNTITGFDDFCYSTNSRVKIAPIITTLTISSGQEASKIKYSISDCSLSNTECKLNVDKGKNVVVSRDGAILIDQMFVYKLRQNNETFEEYLSKYCSSYENPYQSQANLGSNKPNVPKGTYLTSFECQLKDNTVGGGRPFDYNKKQMIYSVVRYLKKDNVKCNQIHLESEFSGFYVPAFSKVVFYDGAIDTDNASKLTTPIAALDFGKTKQATYEYYSVTMAAKGEYSMINEVGKANNFDKKNIVYYRLADDLAKSYARVEGKPEGDTTQWCKFSDDTSFALKAYTSNYTLVTIPMEEKAEKLLEDHSLSPIEWNILHDMALENGVVTATSMGSGNPILFIAISIPILILIIIIVGLYMKRKKKIGDIKEEK